jgi:iron complex outermembrane receptor protein
LAIAGLGDGLALAQEPEEEPQPEASEQVTEEEKKKADELRKALLEMAEGLRETVTVTATRVETDLMKTPVAVTVFDQETLDREGVQNVRDMAQMVPNMDISTINGQSTPVISLRGVRSTNETELGDPSVGVHLDGIYSPRMQGALGLMFDNERVEVLRGPQGTLFGRNSTVGSINIVTAKPKLDAFESALNLQYGNYNAPELQVMVNKPLTDTWAVRFAGRYYQRDSYLDGYWDPNQYDQRFLDGRIGDPELIAPGSFEQCESPLCLTRTQKSNFWVDDTGDSIYALVPADEDDFYMDAKEWAYRASARWQPADSDKSLNLSFQHFRSDSSGGIDLVNCEKLRGRPTYELDPETKEPILDDDGNPIINGVNDCSTMLPRDDTYQAVVNTPGRFFLDIKYLRSQFNWDIKDNLRFIYSAGLEDQSRESAQDMDQSLNAWDQAFFFLPGTGSKSWMGEAQLQSQGNKNFNWITGLNYFYETTETLGYFDNALDEKALFDQPDRSTTAGAIFAQGTYSYSDKWHLTIGGRYSDETKEDKGGVTYICNVANGCASDEIGPVTIDFAQRFDREDLAAVPKDFFEDPSIYPDFSRNDNKGSWSHTDWRVGLDYQKSEDTLLYAYLATGFKSGGIGDVFEGTVVDGDFDADGRPIIVSTEDIFVRTDFDQEEVTTLELGHKQRLLDGKLELRGAYFYSDYENMQYASVGSIAFTERLEFVKDINGDPVDEDGDGLPDLAWFGQPLFTAYFTQNVPGARIQGFELEYDSRPWSGGRIHGYASWLNTKITEDWITKWDYDPRSYFALDFSSASDASNERLQVNMKGNELAVSPAFKLHVTVDHAFLFEQKKMTIVPWVTAHWEDDSYLTIWNVDKHTDDMDFVILDQDIKYTDDRREAWSMVHAGARLYTGDLMAELYMYNITDEVVQWWGGAAEQVPKGSMSTPRTYGIRFGYTF